MFYQRLQEYAISVLAMIPFASALKGLKRLENIASVLGVAGKKIVKEAIEAGLPEIAEKAIKEAMEETAEKLGKEIAEEIVEETAGEITEKIAKETAEELKEEIAEQLTETVSETIAEGAGKLSKRDELLNSVQNDKLRNAVNEIYRPGATTGDGGLADAVRHELSTGELVGGKSHIQKAMERVTNLENIIKKQPLGQSDLDIATKLLKDLKNALGGN